MAGAILAVLFLSIMLISPDGSGLESPGRISQMVQFDYFNTRIYSDGIFGWEGFAVGRVNSTTFIETRLKNMVDAPLTGIEVTCTSYWYDGNYPDRGHVMFRETTLVDIEGGTEAYSTMVQFRWTPSISGSYIINLSAHVPGDARPMSTTPIFFQGKKYQPFPDSYFYSGCWIASKYWDCSSFADWGAEVDGGRPDEGWRPAMHPMAVQYDLQHSYPYAFWAGNSSTWKAPSNGTYSLVTPVLDLSIYDDDPYDLEIGKRRPQIFLLYKYIGNLTPAGPAGDSGLDHMVSTDGGETWEELLDNKGDEVVLEGNTSSTSWSWISRPFMNGIGTMVGLDLGRYQGSKVMLKLELKVSGLNETGYLLDDFVLMGVEPVSEVPFEIGGFSGVVPEVDPGTVFPFEFDLTVHRSDHQVTLRIAALNGSADITVDEDVAVSPEIVEVPPMTETTVKVKVNVSIQKGARSGQGWVMVRIVGEGVIRDKVLAYNVKAIHQMRSRTTGSLPEKVMPGSRFSLGLTLTNEGNIIEHVDWTFVTSSSMVWDGHRHRSIFDPGIERTFTLNITIPQDAVAGPKEGFIIVSTAPLPTDQEVLDAIERDAAEAYWKVHPVEVMVEHLHSVQLVATTGRQYIDEPPENGSMVLVYNLFVLNNGNGPENVTIMDDSDRGPGGITVTPVPNITLEAGQNEVVEVYVNVTFPLPHGEYNVTIQAISPEDHDLTDNSVELIVVIGKPPVSRGVFLLNGSLRIRPDSVIMGQETIVFFTIRTFGFIRPTAFNVNLLVEGETTTSKQFFTTTSQDRELQLTYRFGKPGALNISLFLSDVPVTSDIDSDLLISLRTSIFVWRIDISVEDLWIRDHEKIGPNSTLIPGSYTIMGRIANKGDIDADILSVKLMVVELGDPQNRTVQVWNLTDLAPGQETIVQFRMRDLRPESVYQVTMSFENGGRWKESNAGNDLLTLSMGIGKEPPTKPLWNNTPLVVVALMMIVFCLAGLAVYLLRARIK